MGHSQYEYLCLWQLIKRCNVLQVQHLLVFYQLK